VYGHFLMLLRLHKLTVCVWPEMADDALGEIPTTMQPLWDVHQNIALVCPQPVGAASYEPLIMPGLEAAPNTLFPPVATWTCRGYMIYQNQGDDFDAIPLLKLSSGRADIVWPDMQLRFCKQDTGWTCEMAPVGFVNGILYRHVYEELPDSAKERVHDSIEFHANWILRQLGRYLAELAQPGDWQVSPPKAARIKVGKSGQVKKIHDIARLGHQVYKVKKVS